MGMENNIFKTSIGSRLGEPSPGLRTSSGTSPKSRLEHTFQAVNSDPVYGKNVSVPLLCLGLDLKPVNIKDPLFTTTLHSEAMS